MANIIEDLLTYLEVKHTRYYVNKLFNEHPHNRDMYGLKDMLKTYGIESEGIDIKDKDEKKMIFPSIYHLGHSFVVALNINEKGISLLSNGKTEVATLDSFKRAWDGKTLVITSTENAGEKNYNHNLKLEWITKLSWYSLLFLPIILLTISFIFNPVDNNITNIPLLFLDVLGCYLCYLLLQKPIKGNKGFGNKFCSAISEKGCDAVLSSADSQIFYIYSWSEIGLAYFIANIIIITITPQFHSGIVLITYIAMIYGIWSIWYQGTKVKKWCTLCLSVQANIWLQGTYNTILLYNGVIRLYNVFVSTIIVVLFIALMIVTLHFVVKSYLDNSVISATVQIMRRFQVDNDVFKAKYIKEKVFSDASTISSVFFGDVQAQYKLTIVSNPYCSHCRDLHNKIDTIIRKKDLRISIRFIFLSFAPQYDYACKILIAAYHQMNKEETLDIYSSWYMNLGKNDETFAQDYGLDINSEDVTREYELHKRWTLENKVQKTPYVLVNNHVLPSIYTIEDLEKMDEI